MHSNTRDLTVSPEAVPKVTVVTVVYNRVHQLEETILSVLNLDYPNVEYIIVDGGSTDGTKDIILKYASRLSRWISEPDRGIYDAMNKGIALASGTWINFMNCGDRFVSASALSFLRQPVPEADVLYGNAVILYHGYELPWIIRPLGQMWMRAAFCHQATFTKTALMKSRPFDLSYSISSDFDFLYSVYLDGHRFYHTNHLICVYDFREGASVTHQFRSLEERKKSVLSRSYSFWKWLYFTGLAVYMRLSVMAKKIIGKKITGWVTRILRR